MQSSVPEASDIQSTPSCVLLKKDEDILRRNVSQGAKRNQQAFTWCLCIHFKSRALPAEVERVKDPELCPRGI